MDKVHRIFKISSKTPYIDLNTYYRTKAANTFESDFFKLMNNSCFGKFLECVRDRIDLKIVTNKKSLGKYVKKPNFKDRFIFSENIVAVQLEKELSKVLMYDYHYNVFLKTYGSDNVNLCYMDTDSFLYEITTDDIYHDLKDILQCHFDTSNFPVTHPPHSLINKKVVGKLKDETAGDPIVEYVGLRPKMYSFITNKSKLIKRAKGVKNSAIREFKFKDYFDTLQTNMTMYSSFQIIQSKKHKLHTIVVNKAALSPHDDKRVTLANSIDTLPYGHYSLE